MHLKSLYPDISPCEPLLNVHLALAGRPDQDDWPDFVAHIEALTGKEFTFQQLCKRINDLATALVTPASEGGLGLKAENGDIVGFMSDNSSDYISLSMAFFKVAVPFALISSYSTSFELKHALSLSRVTRLFVAPEHLSHATTLAAKVGIPEDRIYIMNGHIQGKTSVESLIQNVNTRNIPPVSVRLVPKDTLAYLVFSSGTSGLPKAVIISHGNVICSIRQGVTLLLQRLEVSMPPSAKTPDGIPAILAFLPMFHSAGFHSYCIRPFLVPSRVVILPRWHTEQVLDAIPKYKITSMNFVPSLVQQLLTHPRVGKVDFSSVLGLGCGAAYLPREFLAKLIALSPKEASFGEGYGLSECTIAALFQPFPGSMDGLFKENLTATGVLLPSMEARIVRDDGTEADWDEVGELWLRGENVVVGYWNNSEANAESFVDGWLRTGDKFKVDKDQYFYYADRAKDTLKVSGAQVSPVEIEEVLIAQPDKLISDVTVAGVRGGRTNDERIPRAWIVLSEEGNKRGSEQVIKTLEEWHQKNLSRYKWLRGGIAVVDQIPKSPTGKTLRRVLVDQWEQSISTTSKL